MCVCGADSVRGYVSEAVTCTPKGNEHNCVSSQCEENRRHHTIDISAPGWPIITQSQGSASPNYNHFNKIMSFLVSLLHNESRKRIKEAGRGKVQPEKPHYVLAARGKTNSRHMLLRSL